MSIDLGMVGHEWDAGRHSWTARDSMLYSIGVGAGAVDPLLELEYTTENTAGVVHRTLPTMAVVLGGERGLPRLGDFDFANVLHTEQSVEVPRPIPTSGNAQVTGRIVGIYDKGRAAQVAMESTITDADTGVLIARTTSSIFIRGEGGFGGDRGPSSTWAAPDGPADEVITLGTRRDQALLYRLSGDLNPLHSDPVLAASLGFERPILHGLCTFGFTGRALIASVCDGRPDLFGSMSARFSAPVLPGEELAVHVWRSEAGAVFRTHVGDRVVLDRGSFVAAMPA